MAGTVILTATQMLKEVEKIYQEAYPLVVCGGGLQDPANTWPFPDPGAHSHGITDPGHCHGVWTPPEQPKPYTLAMMQAMKATKQDIEKCLGQITQAPITKSAAPVKSAPQPCGKAPPKGINFCPAVGGRYQAWIGD